MENPIIFTETYHSPCGELILGSFGDQLCLCDWTVSKLRNRTDLRLKRVLKAEMIEEPSAVTREATKELDAYFLGVRKNFDLPLLFVGTPFQKSVWENLHFVPYGETRTYAWMAEQLGNERAVRAIGHAIGSNPIAIFAPCHRIIGSDGKLTGFAGGIAAKKFLLDMESNDKMGDNL
jgi:methylated-DNA-[protein]-cysteine S-methyltransferase